jgi:hypothetical protein
MFENLLLSIASIGAEGTGKYRSAFRFFVDEGESRRDLLESKCLRKGKVLRK